MRESLVASQKRRKIPTSLNLKNRTLIRRNQQSQSPKRRNLIPLTSATSPSQKTQSSFTLKFAKIAPKSTLSAPNMMSYAMRNFIMPSRRVPNHIILGVEEVIPGTFCIVNHFTPEPSIGAFEITHQNKIIFSKKASGLFPSVEPTVKRIQ